MSLVVVKCSDGVVVHVDREIITKFSVGFQKKLAENESEVAPITLDNVNSRSLIKVIEYCTVHNDPTISPADAKAWDNKFVKVEPSVLCELASAAYHLEIKSMVDLTCYAIAQLLKGNTPEEIRRIFNIIYDFGPDDDVPPPTIRDKLRNRWIRKTNGKRSTSGGGNGGSIDFTNPLVHALAMQNAPPPSSPSSFPSSSSSSSSSPLPLLSSPAASANSTASPPLPSSSSSSSSLVIENVSADDVASVLDTVHTPTTPQAQFSDTRSVEELLSFINSDEQKPKGSKSSKKAKRKKKKDSSSSSSSVTTTTTSTNKNQEAEHKKDIIGNNKNKNQPPTKETSKDNDKKQRSRKNDATSNHENDNTTITSTSSTPSLTNNNNNTTTTTTTNNNSNNNNGKRRTKHTSLREKLSDSSLSGSESSEDITTPEEQGGGDEGAEEDVEVEEDEGDDGEGEEEENEGEEEMEGEFENEDDEELDGDVDREVEEFRKRLEAAKGNAGQRIALPSALSIALSVLGPKK